MSSSEGSSLSLSQSLAEVLMLWVQDLNFIWGIYGRIVPKEGPLSHPATTWINAYNIRQGKVLPLRKCLPILWTAKLIRACYCYLRQFQNLSK